MVFVLPEYSHKVIGKLILSLSLIIGVSIFVFSSSSYAAVPYQMNFQGRLNDSTGAPMPNGTYNMTFRIYSGSSGGSPLWTETKLVTAGQGVSITTGGLFSTQLGSATSLPSNIWNTSTPLYLEVELPTPATASSKGLLINLGVTTRASTNYFIGFSSNGTVSGKIQGSGANVAYTTSAADYAEYFRANPDDLPQAGELVVLGKANANSVIGNGPICDEADTDCDTNYAKTNVLVALTGQVPVKVDISSNPIAIGDPITISTTSPGIGTKATTNSYIVGYALEATGQADDITTIKVLIRPTYYQTNPTDSLQGANPIFNTLAINGSITTLDINVTNLATIQELKVT